MKNSICQIVWTAICPDHGRVHIEQKTKPATCKVPVKMGPRSLRLCRRELRDHRKQYQTPFVQA